ncbi:MAG: hypothetical protein IPM17_13680 [Verrucomicrobia bacterium]|nr:hypothetical protein [Verrucomicrobiota bacterium]
MMFKSLLPALGMALSSAVFPAKGVVFYGLGNTSNTSDPGTGVPWSSVARVVKTDGSPAGSAVHLGVFYYTHPSIPSLSGWKSYLLTAHHVSSGKVSFDGSTFHDVLGAQQVAANVDLKIIRLDVALNSIPSVSLYAGTSDLSADSVLVGWGRGRSSQTGNTVVWGNDSTIAQRWGTTATLGSSVLVAYQSGSYVALETRLRSDAGDSEAGATYFDSGGGLFQQHGGSWYLVGTTTSVETPGSSTFGTAAADSDSNYFVRISDYRGTIVSLLPIPEPHEIGAVASLALLGFAVWRRTKRQGT